jgi:flagellin-like hook-associated protein FlgL
MLEHIEKALRSAMEAVDTANNRMRQVLAGLNDPEQRTAIAEEVQQELAEAPGWLDEVADLMTDQ